MWRNFSNKLCCRKIFFFCNLCRLVSKLLLLRCTHFCVDKNLTTHCVCLRKIRLRLQLRKMFHRQDYAFRIANMFQPEMLKATLEIEDPHDCEGFSILHICHPLKTHTLKFVSHAHWKRQFHPFKPPLLKCLKSDTDSKIL